MSFHILYYTSVPSNLKINSKALLGFYIFWNQLMNKTCIETNKTNHLWLDFINGSL